MKRRETPVGIQTRRRRQMLTAFATAVACALSMVALGHFQIRAQGGDPCAPPLSNPIVCENQKAGAPASEWDVSGAGDPSIQGFSTDISVNRGQTVSFKISTNASNYTIDIYRMGYYGGFGARKVATVAPSVTLPQNQPACLNDTATGLIDCGNWSVSASWAVPSTAVSGIYFARPTRSDSGGASHIIFVVRDDTGNSDLLFQTSDTTWQAYNRYGGNSLYTGSPAGRAYKVSYNRPLTVRGDSIEDSPFNAEYPMVRWLEASGFNVSYFTGVDSDRRGAEILKHKVFLSVGHDEYWSGTQRTNVEAARGAGVHLAFFSGNEVFWKTRWENSISASGTPHRTLVTYKETHAGAKIDPSPEWTGTWRDPRFSPPADGGRPENALTGTIFYVNSGTTGIRVPAAEGKNRFWRNTSIAAQAPGGAITLPHGTLGYEWDEDRDNGFRPGGLIRLSDTTVSGVDYLQDHGSSYAPGTANHALTLYRHSSGALVFGAGTVQWSWGLDSNHDRGSAAPSVPMQQATVNLFADMGVQPLTLQAGLTTAAPSSDTARPVSTITSPANNSGVPANTFVTISGTAADAGGGVVGGVEVSTNGGTTWHRASGREVWSYAWSTGPAGTVTVLSRATDDSNNVEQPVSGITVNVGAVSTTCPCSIWTPIQAPVSGPDNDSRQVELGTRFRAEGGGYITAVRFYKHSQNGGTHVGRLWTATGSLLASVTFSGESASGWQEASLPAPVAITGGTQYVVSYNTSSGFYAGEDAYFAANGVTNGPLHAPQDGVEGGNGVYAYGNGVFPTQTFNSENYWVDVVFVTSIGPDTTPPTVVLAKPSHGAVGVSPTTTVTGVFNENVSNVTAATFVLTQGTSSVSAAVTYSAGARTATLTPAVPLAHSTTYTARLVGGSAGIADIAGNPLAADYVWSFTTAEPPPPPPNEGPGGPILVVGSSVDPFSRYYAEILRAEGLNAFTATDITLLTPTLLNAHDVLILGAITLTTNQVTMITDWVTAGGNLIAMKPDKKLAALLGLTDSGATLAEGYLLVNGAVPEGAGIVGDTIQFHGSADRYALNGAIAVAALYTNATTATTSPAVTIRGVGTLGGQAAAFTFDLARSVVLTRQGNPAWSGQERDGVAPLRSSDLFFGGTAPDWIDLNKVAIPQADEQQRLLANLVLRMNSDRRPLPRFWYFPRGEKAVVVMTGDDHASNGTPGRFDIYKNDSPVNCNVDDWECVRATSYIYPATPITNAQATAYVADGFELALHISTDCANYTPSSLQSNYANDLAAFAGRFPGVPAVRTNRTHCVVWSDFDTQPQVALANGIRLDTNYYYYPGSWVKNRPGFMTGSGMPMRFAKVDGSMIDVYQAATQMTDESNQTWPFTVDALLDRAIGPAGYYGVFTTNMHTDRAVHEGSAAIVASALARSVPIISARQLLTWLDGRNASSFSNITWNGSTLSFSISVGAGANGLETMIPASAGSGIILGLSRAGTPIAYRLETIKGINYAIFRAGNGVHEATYGVDSAPPVISGVTATPASNAATVAWTTSEASDSYVDYGPAPDALALTASVAGMTVSHSVQLAGLNGGATYYFRVRSADVTGNSATSPAAPAAPASFTTTIPPSLNCPCSLWTPAQTPTIITEPDASAIELGVKFRTSADGFITGIKFYKGPQNTGTHTGHLWTASGAPLSTVTFAGESATGWQTATLPQPVAVQAGTTYVASYHSPNGFYSVNGAYFSAGFVSGPLEALASGTSGNGVYRYGPSGFPTATFNAANYWVDVVFVTYVAPDTVPPTLTGTAPVANGSGTSVTATIRAMFSEPMLAGSVNGTTIQLRDQGSNLISAVVSYDAGTAEGRLQPSTPLAFSSTYTATVKGGSTGVKDVAGNALAGDYSWTFTTTDPPPPPPDEGPGGPILVVSRTTNPFTKYYAEILRAEGLNGFRVSDITAITATTLQAHQIVILGEMALNSAQVTMFANWVTAGGRLIAMRPDKQLANLLGLVDAGATLSDAYLKVNTTSTPGSGIVGETMQFHGVGDLYGTVDAVPVATFYSNATTEMTAPAVTLRSVGAAGGQAAAFAYDLARSVVYTRQGNPAWAGQDRDGITPIRSNDLFFGGTQPDYVDLSKVAIPQADEQQRLLGNLIAHLSVKRLPIPRFGYFPKGLKAVVVLTGDDHANNGTAGQFDFFNSRSAPGCSVEDWECIRATSYIYPNTPITPAAAGGYAAQGFEIAVHTSTGCGNFTAESLGATYGKDLAAFSNAFANLPAPRTNRTHCIVWSDYTSQADVSFAQGIRLDTNYYYWPGTWVKNVPGVFTGSAMPMRFARADGSMVDVYQAATQMTDESGQSYPRTVNALLDRALGPEGYYGAFVANMHTDTPSHFGAQAIVASAQARGVPVISAKQLLDWVDGRNASVFGGLAWAGNALTFSVAADVKARGLQLLLPATSGNRLVTAVRRDGQMIGFSLEWVKGVHYVRFAAATGQYAVDYTVDDVAPTIGLVTVSADAFDATVTWTTNEPATSRVVYGASPNAMVTVAADGSATTQRSLKLTGLAAGTTYYFRVGAEDIVGNGTMAPVSPAVPLHFTTLLKPTFGCPCTIWDNATVPSIASVSDANAVELGVKFRPVADGFVTAVRFYKGPLNTGAHVGKLWTAGGALLGTVVFTNESATGWQQANLAQPVAVVANTVYVVSYHSTSGGYAADSTFFDGAGAIRGPLEALAEGVSGSNGVYRYGASAFPTESFRSTNYWVDLVFVTALPAAPPAPNGLTDTTAADFTAGTPSVGAYVSVSTDGEVILQPAFAEEFTSSTVPTGWSSTAWSAGGGSNIAGGRVSVNEALLGADAPVGAGQSFEFVATFAGDAYQHGGFALSFNENLWIMFSTGGGGPLRARSQDGAVGLDTLIPGDWLGAPHRYRIAWTATRAVFSINGVEVASHAIAIATQMRPMFSDAMVGGAGLIVESMRLGPYATAGMFTSRILDAGSTTNWASASSSTRVPAGASLALSVRFGNTPVPDAGWSAFSSIALGSASLSANSRYVQYRAQLTGDGADTPALESISFSGIDAPPLPTLSVADTSVVEGSGGTSYAVLTVTLSRAVLQDVSFSFTTSDGTATAGADYVATAGTAIIPAGSTSIPILVPIVADVILEPNEAFGFTISAPVNAAIANAQATATIVDDDTSSPTATINDVTITEADTGTRAITFTVTLSAASNRVITMASATADGTATAPSDYTAMSGTVTFNAGDLTPP